MLNNGHLLNIPCHTFHCTEASVPFFVYPGLSSQLYDLISGCVSWNIRNLRLYHKVVILKHGQQWDETETPRKRNLYNRHRHCSAAVRILTSLRGEFIKFIHCWLVGAPGRGWAKCEEVRSLDHGLFLPFTSWSSCVISVYFSAGSCKLKLTQFVYIQKNHVLKKALNFQ